MKDVALVHIFLIIGGRKLGPWMIQALELCPIFPQNSKIVFYRTRGSEITGWRFAVSLFVEDEGQR